MIEQLKFENCPAAVVGSLNGEEIEKVRSLLWSLDKLSGPCSLALSSKIPYSSCTIASEKCYNHTWIVDSSATDLMTPTSKFVHTYTPSPSNRKMFIVNGSLATVAGVTYKSHLHLCLKLSFMCENCSRTLFPYASLLKTRFGFFSSFFFGFGFLVYFFVIIINIIFL